MDRTDDCMLGDVALTAGYISRYSGCARSDSVPLEGTVLDVPGGGGSGRTQGGPSTRSFIQWARRAVEVKGSER